MFRNPVIVLTLLMLGGLTSRGGAIEPAEPNRLPYPDPKNVLAPPASDEPLAGELSLARAAAVLDTMAVGWTRQRKCAHCHTNLTYLLARPAFGDTAAESMREVRRFCEETVAAWEQQQEPPPPRMVVALAGGLAMNDAQTTGHLHPLTRAALDRMWAGQQPDGAWPWFVANYAPSEMSVYFGAVWAAVGLSLAPDGYAQGPSAAAGLARLRGYLQRTPAPNLHDRAWLLWAACRLDGLLTGAQQQAAVTELLAQQREDGGWNLPALLVPWAGRPGRPLRKDGPSDGYATGLVVYVLRQAGLTASRPEIARGDRWLRSNQRASGHWLTPSPNTDQANLLTPGGTCFAVLAIRACAP